jgi:hypothetical protein
MNAPESYDSLFYEALHLSSTAVPPSGVPGTAHGPAVDTTHDVVRKAGEAQAALKSELLQKVPDAVRIAAGKGMTSTEILEFGGSDKFQNEFSFLFLLKGPRDREQRDALFAAGFVPLLDVLKFEMSPFEVRHTWVPGTNANKLTLVWPGRAA